MNEAASTTEIRFQILVEHALVGMFILEGDRFSYVNPKFCQIFDHPAEQLTGARGLLELVAREDQIRVLTQFLGPLKEGVPWLHFYFQGRRGDGRLIDLEVSGTGTTIHGEPAIVGSILDVTERKRTEEELNKLWRAVEQSPVSVVITDLRGYIEYVNPKFIEVSGYAEQELVGNSCRILKSGEMSDEFYQEMWQTINSGREWHGELQNRKKSGELFWESCSISAIKNSEGRITHFVGVKEDITERRRSIDQLRQVQKMEAIGQLAGGVAHDFNNLVTIINGFSTLLIRGLDKGSPHRREAEQILRAGERAADLTRQLLTFSRRQILEPKVLNLNVQVQSVEKMLRRLIGEHLTLVTRLSPETGLIRIDPGQVEQVILNLVVNARDASETGGEISIETGNCELAHEFCLLHPGSTPGSYVRLSVSDHGSGMTDEVKRRIFEPFFTTKEMGRGTGLGLATVYGIVKQSGGYIEVISQPGSGASFNIYLPRVVEPAEQSQQAAVEEEMAGSQTVLVVEDEAGVLELVVQTLSQRGFAVLAANDPEQGLALFEEHQDRIDLLLTDVVMPHMSGPTLAQLLSSRKPQLKVLFMSGHMDNKVNFEKILEQGVQFLPKPFASDGLIRKVKETLAAGTTFQLPGQLPGGSN